MVQRLAYPERQLIVLLMGGPYDGQDIVVSKEERMQGSLMRNGYRYASEDMTSDAGASSGAMRIFSWVDPER